MRKKGTSFRKPSRQNAAIIISTPCAHRRSVDRPPVLQAGGTFLLIEAVARLPEIWSQKHRLTSRLDRTPVHLDELVYPELLITVQIHSVHC